MIKASALLVISSLLSISTFVGDNPEAVARQFLRAAYSHDAAQFKALIHPASAAALLLSTEAVPKERLAEIEAKANSIELRQLQPFRQRGVEVPAGSGSQYPDGTTTRYMTSFDGDSTIVSLVKKEGRWVVDARWWLKLREMSLRDDKSALDEKELLIKRFLLELLRLDRSAVSARLVPGADLGIVFEGAPRVPEPSDVLPSLAVEMPLVEADADEVYPLLSGKLAKKSPAGDETVMVGLYGPFEMVFLLRKIKGEWRVVPQPYYRIINR